MASLLVVQKTLTSLFLLLSFSLLAVPSALATYPPPTTFLITSCNATTYPTLCLQTLLPNATRIEAEPKKLAHVAVSAALSAATSASSTLTHLSKQKTLHSREVTAVSDCLRLSSDALTNLNNTLTEIGHLGGGDKADKEYKRRNMLTALKGVEVGEDTCMEGLHEMNVRSVVISRVQDVMLPLLYQASNAYDIINRLIF